MHYNSETLSYSYSTTNKMHLLSQIIYSCKTLYMFWTVFPPIIRSSKLRIQQQYMSNSCCYLLLSAIRWSSVFLCFFLSCKANARVKLAKSGHGPHSSTLVVIYVVWLLFVLFCVLFVCKCVLPPGDNLISVNKYIVLYTQF